MDIINQVVERLTKDELRYLNMYYGTMPGTERKDKLLLEAIRKAGNNFDEEKTIKRLGYSNADKNNYYRLKNRVLEDIGDGLSMLYTHKNQSLELLHYMALFHIYYNKNLYKTCLYYLKKAERTATATESYELLENVYDNFIRLSFHVEDINPQDYIQKRKANARLVSQLRELDDYLADVSYRLKLTQNFAAADKAQLHRLSEKAKAVAAQTTSQYSKSLQTRIYRALSQVFLQLHNYTELEELVKNSYRLFENEKWFDKENHELKLQMLTFYANALYKNRKLKESLQYSEILGKEILGYNKLHYDRYLLFYYNLQVVNNAQLNPARALQALSDFEQEMRKKKNYYHDTFIFWNRAGILYDMGKYKEALKSLVKLYISDSYEKADKAFKFKVEINELIITCEAGDNETLLRRIDQVLKDYAVFKKQKNFEMDFAIINLLGLIAQSKNYRRDKDIQKKVKSLLTSRVNEAAVDSELIQYRPWLQRKLALSE